MTRNYSIVYVTIPERPDIIKVVITPKRQIYVNVSAAHDAKIIQLVQNLDEIHDYAVRFLR